MSFAAALVAEAVGSAQLLATVVGVISRIDLLRHLHEFENPLARED